MKRRLSFLLLCLLLVVSYGAVAAPEKQYTLALKEGTALQSEPDRGITPLTQTLPHPLLPGESPTTGLPWEGDYLPMLVQIGNAQGTATVNKRTVKAFGIGNRAPWGVQHADIVYEGILYRTGETRFTYLFSDSFAKGEPEKGVGPVRSARIGNLLLREEWQAGLVYSGGLDRAFGWAELLRQTKVNEKGVLFALTSAHFDEYKYRVQGVKGLKAPDNYNADIIGLRGLIPGTSVSAPHPFLFADGNPYQAGYEEARAIHLDWGRKENASHFQYEEATNTYLRFSGAGMKERNWAPYASFVAVDDRGNMEPLAFANLIIQRVEYEYEDGNKLMPVMRGIGKGNADIFIGGRYIPGYWMCNEIGDPTVFYDNQGNELQLARGKTFLAHFPPEDLCLFEGAEE